MLFLVYHACCLRCYVSDTVVFQFIFKRLWSYDTRDMQIKTSILLPSITHVILGRQTYHIYIYTQNVFRDQIPTKPILEDKVTENFIISLCEVSLGRKCVITFTYLFIYIYSLSQQWLVSFANQCRYMFLEPFLFFLLCANIYTMWI